MTAAAAKPVALVTGGRRGIGLGIASALARAGFDLAITDLGEPPAARAAVKQLQALGAAALYVRSDLAALDARAAYGLANRDGAQLGGVQLGKAALEAANGGANGADDHGISIRHDVSSSLSVRGGALTGAL